MSDFDAPRHIALITGGSSGLGLACARALVTGMSPGWQVIVASRDATAGRRAVHALEETAGRGCAEYLPLDLGDLADVRRFGGLLRSRGTRLQALVCNAGLQFTDEKRTRQGLEATFGINHLGHFVLLQEVAGLLSADARIVVVSSGTHDPAQRTGMPTPRWVDPRLLARPELDVGRAFEAQDGAGVVMRRRYTTSKLCNLYFTYELHRRITGGISGLPVSVTVNAFDPGLMPGTGLARDYPMPQRLIWNGLLPMLRPLMRSLMPRGNVHSAEESGAALARLVASPDLAGVSGRYFEGGREISSSAESLDASRASALWATSEALVAESLALKPMSAMQDEFGPSPVARRPGWVDLVLSENPQPPRHRPGRSAWAFSGVMALVFTLAGGAKLAGAQGLAADFARWGFAPWFMTLTGVLELSAAGLLIVPRSARYGALLSILLMCGALLTHWVHGEVWRSIPACVLLGLSLLRLRERAW